MSGRLKKISLGIVKLAISAAILGYLFSVAWNDQSFTDLLYQPKNWSMLVLALMVTMCAVLMTFVRWQILVNALSIPFALRDAMRLGFVAYLFNFFSLGLIGGDVLKSVFLAQRNPGRRTEAVASVIVDRAIGLFALLCVGSLAFLLVDLSAIQAGHPDQLAAVQLLCRSTLCLTALVAVAFGLILTPRFVAARFWDQLARLPLVGRILAKLVIAMRIYNQARGLLLLTLAMSLVIHLLNSLAIYLLAVGLPGAEPSLASHFVIVPIAMVTNAVPLPGGLGAFEIALDFLYRGISTVSVAPRQGFVIALAFRVVQIVIAGIGLAYYLWGRREVRELIREAERQESGPAAVAAEARAC